MEQLNHMSKTYQYRKVKKPMLERKRRARINKCLDELKDLMIESMRQQGDNINRLEKADILELTVEHLKKLKTIKRPTNNVQYSSQMKQPTSTTTTTTLTSKIDSFREGYVHAANEVSKTLATLPNIDIQLGTKVMTHLGHRLVRIQEEQHKQIIAMKQQKTIESRTLLPIHSSQVDSYRSNMSSPAASSGYGSDTDYTSNSSILMMNKQEQKIAPIENNVWRPW